jgi:AAA domain
MPSLAEHQSNEYTKMIVLGDPGTGKTGGLASLVAGGYWLGILDYDNGLESLKQFVRKNGKEGLANVEYRTLRDKRKTVPSGSVIDGQAKAFVEGLKMLDRWKYKNGDGTEVDLGPPANWGPERILVIDSLTLQARAAYDWCEQLIPVGKSGQIDSRMIYYNAQKAIEQYIANITSESYQTNVIVITHVNYIDNEDGSRKGYPNTIGKALSPYIGAYFNSIALCTTKAGGKRVVQTAPTALIDLKNPKPFAMLPEYPVGTGLADFFKVLRSND